MSDGDRNAPLGLLLLEDSPADSRLLVESLRERVNAGTVVIQTVRRLADALRELKRFRFSCVLVDLGLPDGQGVANVARIREADDGIAIVVLTGLSDQRAADEAFRLGAQDYLIKGERFGDELLEFVQRAIDKRRAGTGVRSIADKALPVATDAPRFQPWVYVGRAAFVGAHMIMPPDAATLASVLGSWRGWNAAGVVSGRLALSLPANTMAVTLDALPAALAQAELSPSNLALRVGVPQSEHIESLIEPLSALRASGVDVWLEGWRPACASLHTLTRLPLDGLVLDPDLIAAIMQEPDEASPRFVRASLALAVALGLRVLADGVALAEQYARLSLLGCGLMQGSWFCAAHTATELPLRWGKGPSGL